MQEEVLEREHRGGIHEILITTKYRRSRVWLWTFEPLLDHIQIWKYPKSHHKVHRSNSASQFRNKQLSTPLHSTHWIGSVSWFFVDIYALFACWKRRNFRYMFLRTIREMCRNPQITLWFGFSVVWNTIRCRTGSIPWQWSAFNLSLNNFDLKSSWQRAQSSLTANECYRWIKEAYLTPNVSVGRDRRAWSRQSQWSLTLLHALFP